MIEIKQIQYFVACAQTGSFSKAAEILYTTQPSVSRVIRSMEEELNVQLFERYAKGIGLTVEGERIYKYAWEMLESAKKMQTTGKTEKAKTIYLSTNPSSWFADTFLEFYQLHKEERIHYHVNSIGTHDITQRVQERIDDIGFIYVFKNQMPAFEFFLYRNYLEFEELCRTDIMVHPGKMSSLRNNPGELNFEKMRLVQRFPDEFSPDNYWDIQDAEGHFASDAETVVSTNSDYIMQRLLAMSDLNNISGAYLTAEKNGKPDGIKVNPKDEEQIVFGYVHRRNEKLSDPVLLFVEYVKNKIKEGT